MADFSALKQSIQNYIKQNGNKEITGAILQNILLSMVTTMGDGAINDNASDISDIKGDVQNINGDITDINGAITNINGDITGLNGDLSNEINRAKGAETTTVLFSDGKLVFKNAAGTVLYQLSVDSFLSAITTRLNTGALYAGYATPSSTPAPLASQEVFYLATQAGTYTNFHFNGGDDPIVLTKDGIYFIVSGTDDDDWNAEPMLQLDDVPTASSNNAVKSGGVAEELALGAVYDVSAKNPTAGPNNDGKWESLSALLSDANLNTLIPTSVCKGGMSIKFVSSVDNKYVQYMLKSQDWTTNILYWERIDLEEQLNDIKKIPFAAGKVRYTAVGQTLGSPSYQTNRLGTNIISCKEGDIFKLTIYAGETFRAWATIDSSNVVKRVAPSYTRGGYVTIESGEVGIIFNKDTAELPDGYAVQIIGETTIPELNEKVEIDYNSFNMAYANLSLFVDDDNNIGMMSEGVKVPYNIRTFVDLLPRPNIMSDDTKHQAFPCLSLIDNTLYMSWRKANAHVSINGGEVYRYSKDYGKTWSDETTILTYKNIEGNNYEIIHLERLIDIGNDKVFCLYGRYIATRDSGGDMDIANMNTYRVGGYVFDKTDIFDIDNAVDKGFYSISGLPDCVNVFGAPLYLNGIIYQTVYAWDSSDEYYNPSSYLIKSIDGGNTFVLVGKIADGGDETCIALAGNDKMIAVCRHIGTQGQDLDDSFFCVSKDMGATWEVAKQFPHFWHGQAIQKVGDKYLLMGRRGTYGRVSIALIDEYGDYAMEPYDFGGYGESGYSSIICSYDYLHFASYTRDENTMNYPNVFYFKMRKEDVIKETIK